jgi:hypothetical protein
MYRTNDGQILKAKEPGEIVRELHKLSFSPSENDRAFMRETAERASAQLGKPVRYTNARAFVQDLLTVGLLFDDDETVG